MRVLDLAACTEFYGGVLRLPEIARGAGAGGRAAAAFAVGPSVLEIQEDPSAVSGLLPSGEPNEDWGEVPGSLNHLALYVDDNDQVYAALKGKAREAHVLGGPQAQALGHTYLQRSLLDYRDPNGLIIQISETIDDRPEVQEHRREKEEIRRATGGEGFFHGFDHLSIYITDTIATRALFVGQLGMTEFGDGKMEGRNQAVFAVGLTDLEMNENDAHRNKVLGPGIINTLGFWTDDIDRAYASLKEVGVAVSGPPADVTALPGLSVRAFELEGPDGLPLEVAERR